MAIDGELLEAFGLPDVEKELKAIQKNLEELEDQKSWKLVEEIVQTNVIQFAVAEGLSGELTEDKLQAHKFSDVRRRVLIDLVELLFQLREDIFQHNNFQGFARFLHFKNSNTLTVIAMYGVYRCEERFSKKVNAELKAMSTASYELCL